MKTAKDFLEEAHAVVPKISTEDGIAKHKSGGSVFVDSVTFDTTACPADTNNDGSLTPADFNTWVLAFNTQAPECDQNDDGNCNPGDFNAWVLNFNAGC